MTAHHEAKMAPLKLTYASCKYDRIEALRTGEVQVEGIDLNVLVFPSGRQIFDRMIGGQEFDASELSASEFIAHAGRGASPFVAIPVFPSRVFRHGYIFVNRRAGIRTPKDLEGRRVGLPLYAQTASIWRRWRWLAPRAASPDPPSGQWRPGRGRQWRAPRRRGRSARAPGRIRPARRR